MLLKYFNNIESLKSQIFKIQFVKYYPSLKISPKRTSVAKSHEKQLILKHLFIRDSLKQ